MVINTQASDHASADEESKADCNPGQDEEEYRDCQDLP